MFVFKFFCLYYYQLKKHHTMANKSSIQLLCARYRYKFFLLSWPSYGSKCRVLRLEIWAPYIIDCGKQNLDQTLRSGFSSPIIYLVLNFTYSPVDHILLLHLRNIHQELLGKFKTTQRAQILDSTPFQPS